MLSTPKLALLAAIPIELINFFVVGYPANPSSVSSASQYPAVALQWYLLHLLGIIASDRSLYLRQHGRLDSAVLFLVGLLCTAAFLLLLLWIFRLAMAALRKLSSPMRHAH